MAKLALLFLSIAAVVVAPALTMPAADQQDISYWETKLVGKFYVRNNSKNIDPATQFQNKDLPSNHRIVRPGQAITYDFQYDRLNVILDKAEKCTEVNYG